MREREDPNALPSVNTDAIVHQLQIGGRIPIRNTFADSVQISVIRDIVTEQIIIAWRGTLLAEKITEHTHRETAVISDHRATSVWTPASTWQMFKETHKDSWWLRRLVIRRGIRMVEHRRIVHMHREVTLETRCTEWATYPNSTYGPLPRDTYGMPVFKIERDSFLNDERIR